MDSRDSANQSQDQHDFDSEDARESAGDRRRRGSSGIEED